MGRSMKNKANRQSIGTSFWHPSVWFIRRCFMWKFMLVRTELTYRARNGVRIQAFWRGRWCRLTPVIWCSWISTAIVWLWAPNLSKGTWKWDNKMKAYLVVLYLYSALHKRVLLHDWGTPTIIINNNNGHNRLIVHHKCPRHRWS